MTYKGRALYNLLQMNLKQNPNLKVEPWQVEVYRKLSEEKLFKRLESLQVFLNREKFLFYVDECDSPEEMTNRLLLQTHHPQYEQVYLCVFELWRKLLSYKQSLSLFIDQLDHLIEEYEAGNVENEDELQALLESIQVLLEDNVDKGAPPEDGYHFLSSYSCHDLEVFIYEYIYHQINKENYLYASELLDGFYPYVDNKRWFDLLRIRLVSSVDVQESIIMAQHLLESLLRDPELYLLFEALHFIIYIGAAKQFIIIFNQAMKQLENKEDLLELLMLATEYLELINKEKEAEILKNMIDKQKEEDLQSSLDPQDNSLRILQNIMSSFHATH